MFFNRVITFLNIRVRRLIFKFFYKNKIIFGEKFTFRRRLNIVISKDAKLTIGNNVFFNNDCSVNCLDEINIGDNVLFGEGVKLYDHNHKYKNKYKSIREQGFICSPINIGNNVWISSNVIILKGVTIGNNCVIGASVVVHKDIPENTVLVNNQDQISISI